VNNLGNLQTQHNPESPLKLARTIIIFTALTGLLSACSESTSTASSNPETAVASKATSTASSGTESFSILVGGTTIGKMEVDHGSGTTLIDYEYRNNGRGPTIKEKLSVGEGGLPTAWTIEGFTTFGNKVDEQFVMAVCNGGR